MTQNSVIWTNYWTSEELGYSAGKAYSGGPSNVGKSVRLKVRCVRWQ